MSELLAPLLIGAVLITAAHLVVWRAVTHERRLNDRWESTPTMYDTLDLARAYLRWRRLADSGALDTDQPTEWSHMLHDIATRGSWKDKAILRAILEEEE